MKKSNWEHERNPKYLIWLYLGKEIKDNDGDNDNDVLFVRAYIGTYKSWV